MINLDNTPMEPNIYQNKENIINLYNRSLNQIDQNDYLDSLDNSKNVDVKPKKVTLSAISHFKNAYDQKKEKISTNCRQKTRSYLYKIVHSLYMNILILLLAIYSLYHEDILFLTLPKSFDTPFHHITEAVFFFFLIELIILIISKNKFIGSFYFYLDIISIISLIPEVYLIWSALILLISGQS